MEIGLNEIIDYFAKANVSFLGASGYTVPSGRKSSGARTNSEGAGLVFPLGGRARFSFDQRPYVMEPGMIAHAGPNMHLDKEVLGNQEWKYAVIYYRIPEEERPKCPLFHKHFSIPYGQSARIPDLVKQILVNQNIPGTAARFQAKALFIALLQEVFNAASAYLVDDDGKLMEKAMEYIRLNHADSITVQKVAAEFGLERRRFSYLFERYTGISPQNFLIECRILKSKELLRTCTCSIKQVAECVGYPDSLYFSKAFKKQTGFSPSEFREQVQQSL